MNTSLLKSYLESTRPKTLPLACASILTGSALAYPVNFHWGVMGLCLMTTLFLQILSNFANDYGDHQHGTDTAERVGPLRGIQKGEMTAEQLKKGMMAMIGASFLSGGAVIALAYQTPQDIAVFFALGVLAIVAAITYTVGKKPYGYLGLGDLSVLAFFGFLGVMGTYYLHTHQMPFSLFFPALATGCLATAVLNINNLRDIEQDRQSGKNTLIVKMGSKNGVIYHAMLLLLAVLSFSLYGFLHFQHFYAFVFIVSFPLLFKHWKRVKFYQQGEALRPLLGQMSMLALLTNLLFSLGSILNG